MEVCGFDGKPRALVFSGRGFFYAAGFLFIISQSAEFACSAVRLVV